MLLPPYILLHVLNIIYSTHQHHLSLIFISHPRYTTELYTLLTPLTTDSATPNSHLSPTDGLTDNDDDSPTHTYFNQRQANTTASLPQGDGPAGLGAAQTSIFWGRGLRPKIRTAAGLSNPHPRPKIHTAAGLSNPHPRPKIHTAGAHPSLSHTGGICLSPTLGKQWSHCPSPT